MKNILQIISLLSLVWSLSVASQDFLSSRSRPKIADVIANPQKQPTPQNSGRYRPDVFLASLVKDGAQLIGKLEATHPGATFAFMGRDTQLIADLVDAYFISQGQRGRVVQVGVSKPTLSGLSDRQVVTYLKEFGLDLKSVSTSAPFVFVDTVSTGGDTDLGYQNGRQGRALIKSIFSEWIRMKKDPTLLVEKIGFVGLLVSTFSPESSWNKSHYKNFKSAKKVLQRNREMVQEVHPSLIGVEYVSTSITDTASLINESGYDHHTGAWHDKYRSPKKVGTRLVPQPGPLKSSSERQGVLWMQGKVAELTHTTAFDRKVRATALKYGYSMPPKGGVKCSSVY